MSFILTVQQGVKKNTIPEPGIDSFLTFPGGHRESVLSYQLIFNKTVKSYAREVIDVNDCPYNGVAVKFKDEFFFITILIIFFSYVHCTH